MFNILGVVLLTLIVPIVAVERQKADYVFTAFEPAAAQAVGITNPLCAPPGARERARAAPPRLLASLQGMLLPCPVSYAPSSLAPCA